MPVERIMRLTSRAGVAEEVVIGERRGRDLEARHVELVDEVDRLLVPAGSEPRDLHRFAVGIDLRVIFLTEFRARFRSPLVVPKGLSRGLASSSAV